jgi:predicted membrane protein
MYRSNGYSPPRRALRILGWAILVLGLPLALLAAVHPPNEYQATLGINALDCEGPAETYLFALPALAIYGAGFAVNGWRWRKRLNAVTAVLCLGICAVVVVNVGRALQEDQRQAAACR